MKLMHLLQVENLNQRALIKVVLDENFSKSSCMNSVIGARNGELSNKCTRLVSSIGELS